MKYNRKLFMACVWMLCTWLYNVNGIALARQVLLVTGSEHSAQAELVFYEEGANGVRKEIVRADALVGKNGITGHKHEGDGKTPMGRYSLDFIFGIKPQLPTKLLYLQLKDSHYWVDDSNSNYYNCLVDTQNSTAPDWNSAEHLREYAEQYNYAIVIGYNRQKIIKGAGSAIFLHCTRRGQEYTAGCVAVREDVIKKIIERLEPHAYIEIQVK